MVFINEWLPNPTGTDVKGEFVELFNNGNAPISLNKWKLLTKNNKQFSLSGYSIVADGYLTFNRSVTKLTLRNSDEVLSLYNASGQIADRSGFSGAAPEGESFNRINYGTDGSQHFSFGDPTPGKENSAALQIHITNINYRFGIPINQTSISGLQFIALLIGISAVMAGFIMYTIRQNENLSQLFFEGN